MCLGTYFAGRTEAFQPAASSRRDFVDALIGSTAAAAAAVVAMPQPANARFVMDDETGDYVEVQDVPWQDEWKGRLDKASTMTQDEIFQAARGAGNTNLKSGPESQSSKKRRAMSACRDPTVREKVNLKDEQECTARVFGGDVEFLLEAL